MSDPTALEAHALTKSYRDVAALQPFDVAIPAGTVLGFLGPNGAGKTTVIRLLSTVLRPDSGSFSVGGIPHSRPMEIRRLIGVLPESAGYPSGQTGLEWLTYHGRLYGRSRQDALATATRLIDEVGLTEQRRMAVSAYSRGMRQRLGVARALVNDPQLIILDEPTLGLDPGGQRQLLDLISRLSREHGATVILSTHLLDEVEETCDRVLILNRGRVVADGSVAEVVRRAAAPREALINVPLDQRARAVDALSRANMRAVALDGERRADLRLTMPSGVPADEASTRALGVLFAAEIPVLAFAFEGGRLSDAFLTLTGEGR